MEVEASQDYRDIQKSKYAALKSIKPLLIDPNHDVIF